MLSRKRRTLLNDAGRLCRKVDNHAKHQWHEARWLDVTRQGRDAGHGAVLGLHDALRRRVDESRCESATDSGDGQERSIELSIWLVSDRSKDGYHGLGTHLREIEGGTEVSGWSCSRTVSLGVAL